MSLILIIFFISFFACPEEDLKEDATLSLLLEIKADSNEAARFNEYVSTYLKNATKEGHGQTVICYRKSLLPNK